MEKRKLYTSHSSLARLASERIVLGRLSDLATAVNDHQRRTSATGLGRPYDAALYQRLSEAGATRTSRPGH
jgi:hypothetical protein